MRLQLLSIGLLTALAVAAGGCKSGPIKSAGDDVTTNTAPIVANDTKGGAPVGGTATQLGTVTPAKSEDLMHHVWFPGGNRGVFEAASGKSSGRLWQSKVSTGYSVEDLGIARASGELELEVEGGGDAWKVEIGEIKGGGFTSLGVMTPAQPRLEADVPASTYMVMKVYSTATSTEKATLKWSFKQEPVSRLKVTAKAEGESALPPISLEADYQWGQKVWTRDKRGGYLVRYAPWSGTEAEVVVTGGAESGWAVQLVEAETLKPLVTLTPEASKAHVQNKGGQVLVKVLAQPGVDLSTMRITK